MQGSERGSEVDVLFVDPVESGGLPGASQGFEANGDPSPMLTSGLIVPSAETCGTIPGSRSSA